MRLKISQFVGISIVGLFALFLMAFQDFDRDGLDDAWQAQYGFSTNGFSYTNLIAWWQLDQTNGAFATDRSVQTQTLSLVGGAAWTNGLFNQAIHMDGVNDYLAPNSGPRYNLTNFTFSAWIRTTNASIMTLPGWRNTNGAGSGWGLGVSNGVVTALFSTANTTNQYVFNAGTGTHVNDNNWHHLALSYDATTNKAWLYVDGTLEAQKNITGKMSITNHAFRIGYPYVGVYYKGQIDEIRVYNRALDSNEIAQLPVTYTDVDNDGLSNLSEYQAGTNPLVADTDGDGLLDGADAYPKDFYNNQTPVLNIVSGNFQAGPPSTWLPQALTVQVTTPGNQPIPNAHLTFTVTQGGGLIAADMQSQPSTSLPLNADSGGQAAVLLLTSPIVGEETLVSVSAVAQGNVIQTFLSGSSYADAATPTIDPNGGAFDDQVQVTLASATAGASIYYTTDGSDPTLNSTPYSAPFTLTDSTTINARAFKDGFNDSQVATASFTVTPSAVAIRPIPTFKAIDEGIAIDIDNNVWTWGNNSRGELGNGTQSDVDSRYTPAKINFTHAVAVVGGQTKMAIKDDGTVWAWGNNGSGQVADGTVGTDHFTPTQVLGISDAIGVVTGSGQSYAVKSDGTVWGWGQIDSTTVGGNSGFTLISTPTQVTGIDNVKQLASGISFTLALKNDGTVWGWGQSQYGALGVSSLAQNGGVAFYTPHPIPINGLTGVFTSVAAGAHHSVALKSDGTVWTWGSNYGGELGNGASHIGLFAYPTPAPVIGLDHVIAISIANDHSLALRDDGTVWTWGGLAANGITTTQSTLVQIHGLEDQGFLTNVVYIKAAPNGSSSFAIKSDGSSWAWGGNFGGYLAYGRTANALGDGTTIGRITPVQLFQVPKTEFNPDAGTYSDVLSVTVDNFMQEPGATIHYTTNGNDPTENDPVIAAGDSLPIEHPLTLKAKGWKEGFFPSVIKEAYYKIQVKTPVLTPTSTTFNTPQAVTITCATAGAVMHYTTDGREPTETDPVIASGTQILIDRNLLGLNQDGITLKAKAWKLDWVPSEVGSGDYQVVDADSDGLPDAWERQNGLDLTSDQSAEDPDHDGLTNVQEFQNFADPHNSDTNGNGILDADEVAAGKTPGHDSDGDGLADIYETQIGTNPSSNDSDGNGVPDNAQQLFYTTDSIVLSKSISQAAVWGGNGPASLRIFKKINLVIQKEPGAYYLLAKGFDVTPVFGFPTIAQLGAFPKNPRNPTLTNARLLANGQVIVERSLGTPALPPGSGINVANLIGSDGALNLEARDISGSSFGNAGIDETDLVAYLPPQVVLNVDGVPEQDKVSVGGLVGVNGPAKQATIFFNHVANDLPTAFQGSWSLTFNSDKIKVFASNDPFAVGNEIAPGQSYPRGSAKTIYLTIHGTAPSISAKDVPLVANFYFAGKTYGDLADLTVAGVSIAVDANRDGAITFDDSDKTTEEEPFRFWVNDDDDFGELAANDFPGQPPSINEVSIGENEGADYRTLHGSGKVDGLRDLVDFFPVALDFGIMLNIMPPGGEGENRVEYRLRQDNGALNFVYTRLRANEAMQYLTQSFSSGFGHDCAQPPGDAETILTSSSTPLNEIFLSIVKANGGSGVLLMEGAKPGEESLVVEVWKGSQKITESRIQTSLSDARKMYRWINLREKTGDTTGRQTDVSEPSNYPDNRTNQKHFVFVHGYNVNIYEAEAAAAEMFKRMYQAGSKAMFSAVDWHGDQGRIPGLGVSGDYYENVKNAFTTSPYAMIEINGLPGEKFVTAHSLGNMLVSSAIKDHGLKVGAYFMLDAAVAVEAYDGTVRHAGMIHPDWLNYDERIWASEWHLLFSPEQGFTDDGRYKLTWRDRFGPISNAYNFYSPGEDALRNGDGVLHTIFSAEYAFTNQEMLKGTAVAEAVTWDGHGGWGFNTVYNSEKTDEHPDGNPLEAVYANAIPTEFLRASPFFKPIKIAGLFGPDGSNVAKNTTNRASCLAECIPSRTFASGCNEIAIYNSDGGAQRNFNLMDLRVGWPQERLQNRDSLNRWLHSDWQMVAYFYTYPLFNKFIEIGSLNQ